jgi:hypothetical protein
MMFGSSKNAGLVLQTGDRLHLLPSRLRHYAASRKVAGSIPDEVIGFSSWHNRFNYTIALWSTQPLKEMSTRNLPGSKGRQARKSDNLTAICEPIVYKMWEPPRPLAGLEFS